MNTETPAVRPALLRLLQLSSPTLPIGGYAYSQGLEHAVNSGWVTDEAGAQSWILGVMKHLLCHLDIPVLARLYGGWRANDEHAIRYWSGFLHASRESCELQSEDQQQGTALARLLAELSIPEANTWETRPDCTLATLFALAASRWDISLPDMAAGYLWAWVDNQVAAAIKLVPLGQTAGQRILSEAISAIPHVVQCGLQCDDQFIGFTAPGFGIASALHETQYSRLFRS